MKEKKIVNVEQVTRMLIRSVAIKLVWSRIVILRKFLYNGYGFLPASKWWKDHIKKKMMSSNVRRITNNKIWKWINKDNSSFLK